MKRVQVVDEKSAVIEQARSIGLNTDHSGLNKFRGKDDPNFVKVTRIISQMVNDAVYRTNDAASKGSPGKVCHGSSAGQLD
jgi:hypothetical protein